MQKELESCSRIKDRNGRHRERMKSEESGRNILKICINRSSGTGCSLHV